MTCWITATPTWLSDMRTITLTTPLTFTEALGKLIAGECLGIRPEKNAYYVKPFKPAWMNKESPDFMLGWESGAGSGDVDTQIRSNQYMEKWFLVVADHRFI